MRNKLKKIWNKEDGFTLVELLGVIVILGIILAIAIPGIGNIVENARTSTEKHQEELVLDAARMYFLDGADEKEGAKKGEVSVELLKSSGYLESKDINATLAGKTIIETETGLVKFKESQ